MLLADVGLILEYAALLGNKESSAVPDLRHSMCLQHVARLAQRRLIDFCELGWPALTAQVTLHSWPSTIVQLQSFYATMRCCALLKPLIGVESN